MLRFIQDEMVSRLRRNSAGVLSRWTQGLVRSVYALLRAGVFPISLANKGGMNAMKPNVRGICWALLRAAQPTVLTLENQQRDISIYCLCKQPHTQVAYILPIYCLYILAHMQNWKLMVLSKPITK